MSTESSATAGGRSSRPRRQVVLGVLGLLLIVVLLAVAWVGVRTLLAKEELEAAVRSADGARQDLAAGDADAAERALREVGDRARHAAELTSDPLSVAARVVPVVGPNLTAFAQIASGVDRAANDALAPLASLAGLFDEEALAPRGGRIDLAPIQTAAPVLESAERVMVQVSDDIDAIDTSATLPVVTDAVDRLDGALDEVTDAVSTASRTARLLPAMLGAEGEREYLLLFQNNAELRARGGLPGALALISTDGGAFELTEQASANDFPRYPSPVLPLDYATESLYGSLTARYLQNVGLTPDFPTSARLAQEMWKRERGVEVDGVIAVDPVLLGYLLAGTGPVTLSTGDVLGPDNAVDFLLSEVYAKYPDNATQDAVFADAAQSVFAALGSDGLDAPKLLDALTKGAGEGRLSIYNSRPEEQELLEGTMIGGTLPASDDESATVGVFLDDATGAKMDYYLDASTRVEHDACRADAADWAVSVRLTSSAPSDAATSLPPYVTGDGLFGVSEGDIRTRLIVYGPIGSTVSSVMRDGEDIEAQSEEHLGRTAVQIVVDLAPGETTEIDVDFVGTSSAESTTVQMTPLIRYEAPKITTRNCG